MTSSTVAIRVRGVSHQFGEEGDRRFVRALSDSSLDVARGELLCLIGPSGCGKSTLLNVIGGLMEPSSGAAEALEAVGLRDFAQHYPAQLSGGMRQRAALARALSLETPILLMDEPFGALDEQTRMILGEDLSVLLARRRKTIVFVTHSLGEAVFLADRVAAFSARPGTIKQVIAVDEPHPRKPEFVTSAKFTSIRNELYALLHDEIRKTVAETSASAAREGAP